MKGTQRLSWLVLLACALMACPQWLSAQQANASIGGVIKDPSGAAVPGATLTLRSGAMGQSVTTLSGSAGLYLFPIVQPGTYNLTASAKGFTTYVRKGITVYLAQKATVDVTLTVGSPKQVVTVSANASPLDYEGPVQKGTIAPGVIDTLPSSGRSQALLPSSLLASVIFPMNSGCRAIPASSLAQIRTRNRKMAISILASRCSTWLRSSLPAHSISTPGRRPTGRTSEVSHCGTKILP